MVEEGESMFAFLFLHTAASAVHWSAGSMDPVDVPGAAAWVRDPAPLTASHQALHGVAGLC